MHSRYDFIKDPKQRRYIARCQVASALVFITIVAAGIVAAGLGDAPAPDEAPGARAAAPATDAAPRAPGRVTDAAAYFDDPREAMSDVPCPEAARPARPPGAPDAGSEAVPAPERYREGA